MNGDFIDSFIELTEGLSSPHIFRRWAAIATVAGALERKVWIRTQHGKLYPNTYIFLVAPPGVGKTEMTWRVRSLWKGLDGWFTGSTSLSKASLIDELAKAARRWVHGKPPNPVESFNSLVVAINELGVLLPGYDNEFMNTLTDLWDGKGYAERKRTKDLEINIPKPCLNLFAATTPSYFSEFLPEGAWDQGFMARAMLIYSGERQVTSLFDLREDNLEDDKLIRNQLNQIGKLYGEFRVSPDAAHALETFNRENTIGNGGGPDHPKLIGYGIRRTVHLLKLSMICSAAASTNLEIHVEDVERARAFMIDAESNMLDIFKAMSQAGTGKVMQEAWHYIFTLHAKEGKPIQKHRLLQFLQEHLPLHQVEVAIKLMEQSKMIKKSMGKAGPQYEPLGKEHPNAF